MNKHSKQPQNRRGAALVEAAVCLPLMLLLILGSIELCQGVYQQHAVRATAHECARVAASGEKDGLDVQHIANEVLLQRGLDNFDIDIDVTPRTVNVGSVPPAAVTHFDILPGGVPTSGLANLPRGTLLRLKMTVTRPNSISFIGLLDSTIHSQVYFIKER